MQDQQYAANIAVEQEVIGTTIKTALFIIARFWYTPTHVQSKPSSKFAPIHRLPK